MRTWGRKPKMKQNWSKLKENRCPKCETLFDDFSNPEGVMCSNKRCDFYISLSEFKERTTELVNEEIDNEYK